MELLLALALFFGGMVFGAVAEALARMWREEERDEL